MLPRPKLTVSPQYTKVTSRRTVRPATQSAVPLPCHDVVGHVGGFVDVWGQLRLAAASRFWRHSIVYSPTFASNAQRVFMMSSMRRVFGAFVDYRNLVNNLQRTARRIRLRRYFATLQQQARPVNRNVRLLRNCFNTMRHTETRDRLRCWFSRMKAGLGLRKSDVLPAGAQHMQMRRAFARLCTASRHQKAVRGWGAMLLKMGPVPEGDSRAHAGHRLTHSEASSSSDDHRDLDPPQVVSVGSAAVDVD